MFTFRTQTCSLKTKSYLFSLAFCEIAFLSGKAADVGCSWAQSAITQVSWKWIGRMLYILCVTFWLAILVVLDLPDLPFSLWSKCTPFQPIVGGVKAYLIIFSVSLLWCPDTFSSCCGSTYTLQPDSSWRLKKAMAVSQMTTHLIYALCSKPSYFRMVVVSQMEHLWYLYESSISCYPFDGKTTSNSHNAMPLEKL